MKLMTKKFTNYKLLSVYIFILVTLIYLPYKNIISWGGYAGYVLQAQVAFSSEFYEFIKNQKILYSYSYLQIDPIYTPLGLPILINATSVFHSWNLLNIKLITPIFLILTILIIIKNYKFNTKFLYLIPVFNLSIVDEFRDAQSEIPGLFFLFLGFTVKTKLIGNLFLVFSTFFRPTFVPIIVIFYLFKYFETKKIKDLIEYLFIQLGAYLIIKLFFNLNFYGDQSNSGQDGVVRLLDLFFNLDLPRFTYIMSELGRTFTGFTNKLNIFVGFFIILSALFFRNKFGYMALGFILVHFGWDFPYFVRFFIPVVFLYTISLGMYLNNLNLKKNYFNFMVIFLLIVYSLQIVNQVSNLDSQRGPHKYDSIDMIDFAKNYSENTLFRFHSPRVLRFLTGIDSYKYDGKHIENSVIICEFNYENCLVPDGYIETYSNDSFKFYEK